ncbi:hypothetical protein [Thomasclavelia cocleata]|uniref:hypothetical protein n=2 Tax=Thomasclavelia cocleata TaxID=69824 RepID=UPI00242F3E9E|nr:hypothetical protein [Thomasclavelia cocleata]
MYYQKRGAVMENKEYRELKRLVSKADRINIVNLVDADIANKDNYFSNIIYLRKKLSYQTKEKIFNYCKSELNYQESLETLFKIYDRKIAKKKDNNKSVFAKRTTIAIAKEKYFRGRTLEDIVNDSENTDYYFSIGTLNNYKSGKSKPNYANIEKLAKCINVMPQYLKEDDKYIVDFTLLPLDYDKKREFDSVLHNMDVIQERTKIISVFKKFFLTFHDDFGYPLQDEFKEFINNLDVKRLLSDILFQVEDAFFNMNNIDKSFELAQDTPMYAYCDNFSIIDRVPHIQKLKDNYYKYQLEYWLIDNDYEDYTIYDNFYICHSKKEYLELIDKKMIELSNNIKKEEEFLKELKEKDDQGEIPVINSKEDLENYLKEKK